MRSVAAAVVLLALLSAAGCGADEPAPPAVVVPAWAQVAPEQIAEAEKHGVPVAFENDLGMRFVLIPAGTFLMGSAEAEEGRYANEGPPHEVTLSQPFYLATTETTQAVWKAVMNESPSQVQGASLPVAHVSWEDCQRFVKRLNETVPGGGYRLPTEAEWECACRAGTTTRYGSGDIEEDLARVGWYRENSGRQAHPVGEKPASPWGLHDMHGNVWEWCEDHWHHAYEGGPADGSAWMDEGRGFRVYRGGSWISHARSARSADRSSFRPSSRYYSLGFRPARTVTIQ